MTTMRKVVVIATLVVVAIIATAIFSQPRPPTVVGNLPPGDLVQILKLVNQDLRNRTLPTPAWDSLRYPRYIIDGIRDYHAQRLLWVEAFDDGHVEVFAGVSKAVIRNEGHHWLLRKTPAWMITGYSYWASSAVGPPDMSIPR